MSLHFQKVIQRLGLSEIQRLIEPAVLEIIYAFDKTPNKTTLCSTICDIYNPIEILRDPKKRSVLLEHLSKEHAERLAIALGLDHDSSNPWDAIKKFRFNTKSHKSALYNIFKLEQSISIVENKEEKQYTSKELLTSTYPLFDYQENAVLNIKTILKERNRVLLHMPTGAGKTRTCMNIICDFLRSSIQQRNKKMVIWLADTEELCEQASDEFTRAWHSLGSGQICQQRLYGKHDLSLSEIEPGFLVAGLAKLNSLFEKDQKKMIDLAKICTLVIFDEAHKILAPTYQHAVELFIEAGNAKLIGLSATPGRTTNNLEKNKKFANFFNKQKVTLEVEGYESPIEYLQNLGYLAHINYQHLPYESKDLKLTHREIESLTNGDDVSERILEELGKDTLRNVKILNQTLKLVNENKKIILFACSVSHTEALHALLKYKGIRVGSITSNTEKSKRHSTIEAYKKGDLDILVNFGVLTTGFDAPITNVAFITRPTTSLMLYSQMIGRAARGVKAGGNESCDIYTVIDQNIPGFRSITEAFKHWDDAWE